MAYQAIGRGTSANDGTGDDLRTGAGKVNANFVELYTLLGDGSALTSDTVVLLAETQTLTNKTLTAPTITGAGAIAGVFTGNITGDVTGNVTGDLTGNVSTSSGNLQLTAATQIVEVRGDGSATEGQIVLNCETNAHGQTIKPQPHSAAVTNELLLPADGNSTLVSEIATQTLTNKTIDAASNTLSNIGNASLTNDDVTIGTTAVALGASSTTLAGLTSVESTAFDGQVILSEDSQTGDGSTAIAVDPTKGVTLLTSSATGDTATLADGTTVGTTINIILESDGGGDITLQPTTFLNGSTITFADAGDQVTLVWTGTNGWAMIGAGYGAPVIA
jgi:hypothetical protein